MNSGPKKVLEIRGLSKQYRLGKIGTGSLAYDLQQAISGLRRSSADHHFSPENTDSESRTIMALSDVNMDVYRGEVLGLIGKNGAGKSTLLKILSRVTEPSSGTVKSRGRIASLLEVGTGMHPELSGRENIFLNGAILGMSKKEIESKFDEIVEFSDCARFIDTPVKRYSSGMKVRLGFSVAAFLEPEILIVDEVLAVGDAAFQQKAIAKMQEVSSGGARTVLFVSHNMTAVKSLCPRTVLLESGKVVFDGDTDRAISRYLGYDTAETCALRSWDEFAGAPTGGAFTLLHAEARSAGSAPGTFTTDKALEISITLRRSNTAAVPHCTLHLLDDDGTFIAASSSLYFGDEETDAGETVTRLCRIPAHFFNQRTYRFNLLIIADRQKTVIRLDGIFRIPFITASRPEGTWMGTPGSYLLPGWEWR
jgi:lipopolysaccharide transport system ATP-binding protein